MGKLNIILHLFKRNEGKKKTTKQKLQLYRYKVYDTENGVWAIKVGQHVKELRMHMCNSSAASKGLRDFVENHYVTFKKHNSTLPILVRECEGVTPKIWVRADRGKESVFEVDNLSAEDIIGKINELQ